MARELLFTSWRPGAELAAPDASAAVHRFAANSIALADASAQWRQLRQQGIPYQTLLANDINHPDPRCQKIFADSLIDLLPGK